MFKAIKEFFLGKPEPVAETVTASYKLEPVVTPPAQPMIETPAVVVPPLETPSPPTAPEAKVKLTKRPPKVVKPTAPDKAPRAPKVSVEKKSDSKKTVKAVPAIKKVAAAKITPAVKKPRTPKVK